MRDTGVDPGQLLAEDDRLDARQAARMATQIDLVQQRRVVGGRRSGGNGNGRPRFPSEVMARVRRDLLADLDPDRVEERVVQQVLSVFPMAGGAAVDECGADDASWLVRSHAAGLLAATNGRRQSRHGTIAGEALRSGRLARCDDAGLLVETDRLARVDGVGSVVCVPLYRTPGFAGVLTVVAPRLAAFGESDLARLGELAEFVAAVLAGARDVSSTAASVLARRDDSVSVSLAAFVAGTLGYEIDAHLRKAVVAERIRSVLTDKPPHVQFQPIAHLRDGRVVGYEALARFSAQPRRSPDVWFGEAATVGLGTELELLAASNALAHVDELPAGAYLAVNVSPDTAASAPFAAACREAASYDRLVIELTEHAPVADYPRLTRALSGLRADGVRLAIDDAGAGFASLRHVLRLRPDIIKLDIALTRGIDTDPVRQALATALISFAGEVGAVIVAEGVESRWEADALCDLGVEFGQGWHIARPGPLPGLAVAG
ncbi:MAG: diguanylate phosphodiesterase [Acidimicrobiales bacterium]|nr:diguanylate phosphodiesterase [Acidimicrobiales bacterium]